MKTSSFVWPGTRLRIGGGGREGKKRGQIEKIWKYRRAVDWGGGKGHPFLSLDYLSFTARFFFFRPRRFFSFFPQCGAWSQAKFCPVEILGK